MPLLFPVLWEGIQNVSTGTLRSQHMFSCVQVVLGALLLMFPCPNRLMVWLFSHLFLLTYLSCMCLVLRGTWVPSPLNGTVLSTAIHRPVSKALRSISIVFLSILQRLTKYTLNINPQLNHVFYSHLVWTRCIAWPLYTPAGHIGTLMWTTSHVLYSALVCPSLSPPPFLCHGLECEVHAGALRHVVSISCISSLNGSLYFTPFPMSHLKS